MKQLIDSTATLWLKGEMEGKPAGVFTCTASTHGGQETTLVTMMIPLLHLGMLIVGVPYSVKGMLHTEAREAHHMAPRRLLEDRASCSQRRRTSTLLGHWAGEWPRSQQESVANQHASGEPACNRTDDHELSIFGEPLGDQLRHQLVYSFPLAARYRRIGVFFGLSRSPSATRTEEKV
jgi:hypothetical protein